MHIIFFMIFQWYIAETITTILYAKTENYNDYGYNLACEFSGFQRRERKVKASSSVTSYMRDRQKQLCLVLWKKYPDKTAEVKVDAKWKESEHTLGLDLSTQVVQAMVIF